MSAQARSTRDDALHGVPPCPCFFLLWEKRFPIAVEPSAARHGVDPSADALCVSGGRAPKGCSPRPAGEK